MDVAVLQVPVLALAVPVNNVLAVRLFAGLKLALVQGAAVAFAADFQPDRVPREALQLVSDVELLLLGGEVIVDANQLEPPGFCRGTRLERSAGCPPQRSCCSRGGPGRGAMGGSNRAHRSAAGRGFGENRGRRDEVRVGREGIGVGRFRAPQLRRSSFGERKRRRLGG